MPITNALLSRIKNRDLVPAAGLIDGNSSLDAAKNLEFEKAAETRDRLYRLREQLFGVALPTET